MHALSRKREDSGLLRFDPVPSFIVPFCGVCLVARLKKRLDRRELDALTLSTPEARTSYEEALRTLKARRRHRKSRSVDPKT